MIVQQEISISWNIEDVQEVRPDLNGAQAWEVLRAADQKYDASIGLNWDLLEYYANTLFPNVSFND